MVQLYLHQSNRQKQMRSDDFLDCTHKFSAELGESLPTGKNVKEISELANNPRKTLY
jgi:hypothetical protein